MTERLQEILNRKPSKWGNLTVKEFEGDIKLLQERVEELEKQSHGIELNLLNDEVVRLEKQNQCYKQALEQITQLGWSDNFGGGHNYTGEYHAQAIKISEKALECEG